MLWISFGTLANPIVHILVFSPTNFQLPPCSPSLMKKIYNIYSIFHCFIHQQIIIWEKSIYMNNLLYMYTIIFTDINDAV